MDIEGRYCFAASPQQMWDVICDPAILKQSIPQCETIERISETQWRGTARVKVGPLSTLFSGLITLSNLNPPDSYTITIEADSWMGHSRGTADVTLTATPQGTELFYKAHAEIGIKALDKAMGLASGLAHSLADKFFLRLTEAVEAQNSASGTKQGTGI